MNRSLDVPTTTYLRVSASKGKGDLPVNNKKGR